MWGIPVLPSIHQSEISGILRIRRGVWPLLWAAGKLLRAGRATLKRPLKPNDAWLRPVPQQAQTSLHAGLRYYASELGKVCSQSAGGVSCRSSCSQQSSRHLFRPLIGPLQNSSQLHCIGMSLVGATSTLGRQNSRKLSRATEYWTSCLRSAEGSSHMNSNMNRILLFQRSIAADHSLRPTSTIHARLVA